jgi:hypothetical protein
MPPCRPTFRACSRLGVQNRVPLLRVSFKTVRRRWSWQTGGKLAHILVVSPLSFDRPELVAHACTGSRKCSTHGQAAPSIKPSAPRLPDDTALARWLWFWPPRRVVACCLFLIISGICPLSLFVQLFQHLRVFLRDPLIITLWSGAVSARYIPVGFTTTHPASPRISA